MKIRISMLTSASSELGDVFMGFGDSHSGENGLFATAQLVHIEPEHDRVAIFSAGHPPALLRLPDGTVERALDAWVPMLGAVTPGRTTPVYCPFPPGSLLVCYTDGLVERRDESIDDSIDRLATLLRELDPASGVDDLVERIVAAPQLARGSIKPIDDDLAEVAMRRTT